MEELTLSPPADDAIPPIMAGEVELTSAAFADNPYPAYKLLREKDPVCFIEPLNAWLLTRYEDIRAVLMNKRFQVRFEQYQINRMGPAVADEPYFRMARELVLFADPPRHQHIKALLMKRFGRRQAEERKPAIRAIVHDVIDQFIGDGRVDVTQQFSHQVPLRIISEMLGVGREDQATLAKWIEDWGVALEFTPMSPRQLADANAAALGFEQYFHDLIAERRKRPGDDLVSDILAQNSLLEEPFDEFTIVSNLMILYFGGQDTQQKHVGNIIMALHDWPDEFAWLREDPSRAWFAVDELMRYDPVGQVSNRIATEDTEICGYHIREGQSVLVSWGSANRDPSVFPDPDRFNLMREQTEAARNLTFGLGAHACVGANFARISVPMMIEGLLERIPNFEIDLGGLKRHASLGIRGYDHLPIGWSL